MKFFPTIKYVDEIPVDMLNYELQARVSRGAVFGGICTLHISDNSIIILIVRDCGSSKFVLFHELCHWFVYRFTKLDSKLQKKLNTWVEKHITYKEK